MNALQCVGTPYIFDYSSFFKDLKPLEAFQDTTADANAFLHCLTSVCERYVSLLTPRALVIQSGGRHRLALARSILPPELWRAYGSHSRSAVWSLRSSTFYVLSSTGRFIFIYKLLPNHHVFQNRKKKNSPSGKTSGFGHYTFVDQHHEPISRLKVSNSVESLHTSFSSDMSEACLSSDDHPDVLKDLLQSPAQTKTRRPLYGSSSATYQQGVREAGAWKKMLLAQEQCKTLLSETEPYHVFLIHTLQTSFPTSCVHMASQGLLCSSSTGLHLFMIAEDNPFTVLFQIDLSHCSLASTPFRSWSSPPPWGETPGGSPDGPRYFPDYVMDSASHCQALLGLQPSTSPPTEDADIFIVDMALSERLNLLAVVLSNGCAALFVFSGSSYTTSETSPSLPPYACVEPLQCALRLGSQESLGICLSFSAIHSVRFHPSRPVLAVALCNGTVHVLSLPGVLKCVDLESRAEAPMFHIQPSLLLEPNTRDTHDPQLHTTVTAFRWSRCGQSLALGWSIGGPVVVSCSGVVIFSALHQASPSCHPDPKVTNGSVLAASHHCGVSCLEWSMGGLGLLMTTTCSPYAVTEIPFYRSSPRPVRFLSADPQGDTVSTSPGSARALIGARKLLVYRSAAKEHETRPFMEIPLPSYHYMKRNWPLRMAVESPNRRYLLATGGQGVALYSFHSSRWCLFGNASHERFYQIHALPIGWYSSCLFFLCSHYTTDLHSFSLRNLLPFQVPRIHPHSSFNQQSSSPSSHRYMISFFDVRQPLQQEKSVAQLKNLTAPPLHILLFSTADHVRPGWQSPLDVSIHSQTCQVLLTDPCTYSGQQSTTGSTGHGTSPPQASSTALEVLQHPPLLGVYDASFHFNAYMLVPCQSVVCCTPVDHIIPQWIVHHLWTVNLCTLAWNRHPREIIFVASPYHLLVHHADSSLSSLQLYPQKDASTQKNYSPLDSSTQTLNTPPLTSQPFADQGPLNYQEIQSILIQKTFPLQIHSCDQHTPTTLLCQEAKPFLQNVIQVSKYPEAQFSIFFPLPTPSFDPFGLDTLSSLPSPSCLPSTTLPSYCPIPREKSSLSSSHQSGNFDSTSSLPGQKHTGRSSSFPIFFLHGSANTPSVHVQHHNTHPFTSPFWDDSPQSHSRTTPLPLESSPWAITHQQPTNPLEDSTPPHVHLDQTVNVHFTLQDKTHDKNQPSCHLVTNQHIHDFVSVASKNTPGSYCWCETLTDFYLIAISVDPFSNAHFNKTPTHTSTQDTNSHLVNAAPHLNGIYRYFVMRIPKRHQDTLVPTVIHRVNANSGTLAQHSTLITPTPISVNDHLSSHEKPFWVVHQFQITEIPVAQFILTAFLSLDSPPYTSLGYRLAQSFCHVLSGSLRFTQILKVLLKKFLLIGVCFVQEQIKLINEAPNIWIPYLMKNDPQNSIPPHSSSSEEESLGELYHPFTSHVQNQSLHITPEETVQHLLRYTLPEHSFSSVSGLDPPTTEPDPLDMAQLLDSFFQRVSGPSPMEPITPSLLAQHIFTPRTLQYYLESLESNPLSHFAVPLRLLLCLTRFLYGRSTCIRSLVRLFNLLGSYTLVYADVIICAIREVDPLLSTALLYPCSGQSLEALYQSQLEAKNLHVASLYLLAFQNAMGPLMTRLQFALPLFQLALQHNLFVLARQLLRFYLAIYVSPPDSANAAESGTKKQYNHSKVEGSGLEMDPISWAPHHPSSPHSFHYSKPFHASQPPIYPSIVPNITTPQGVILAHKALERLEKIILNVILECIRDFQWLRLISHVTFLKLDLHSWLHAARQDILQDFINMEKGIENEFSHHFPTAQHPTPPPVVHSSTDDNQQDASKFLHLIISFRKQFVCDFVKFNLSHYTKRLTHQNPDLSPILTRSFPPFNSSNPDSHPGYTTEPPQEPSPSLIPDIVDHTPTQSSSQVLSPRHQHTTSFNLDHSTSSDKYHGIHPLSTLPTVFLRQNVSHAPSQDYLQCLVSVFLDLELYILPMAVAFSTCDLNLLDFLHRLTPKSKSLTYKFMCCRGHEI